MQIKCRPKFIASPVFTDSETRVTYYIIIEFSKEIAFSKLFTFHRNCQWTTFLFRHAKKVVLRSHGCITLSFLQGFITGYCGGVFEQLARYTMRYHESDLHLLTTSTTQQLSQFYQLLHISLLTSPTWGQV